MQFVGVKAMQICRFMPTFYNEFAKQLPLFLFSQYIDSLHMHRAIKQNVVSTWTKYIVEINS